MGGTGKRGLWAAAAAIVLLPLLFHLVRHHGTLPTAYRGEAFVAFRCAGDAVLHRENPYLTEPLRTCEARAGILPSGVVEPAPLPPVTLGLFALFAALPFGTAAALWAAVLLAAYGVTALALVRLAPRVPAPAIWLALAPGLVFLSGYYGETPPIAAAGLAVGGLALVRARYAFAAAAVTAAVLFEPHIGAAAWLTIALFVPGVRLWLALFGLAAVGASVLAVGVPTLASYLGAVLPAHALSELPANDQYSLTSFLYQLGWPARAAVSAGIVSYAGALAVGCCFAPLLARRARARELLVFFPACAVLLGGSFVHDLQMSLAIPLAVLVASGASRAWLRLAFSTLLVGAVPEPETGLYDLVFGAAAAYAAGWSVAYRASGKTSTVGAGTIGMLAYVAVAIVVHGLGTVFGSFPRAYAIAPPGALAESGWRAYVTAVSHPMTAGELVARLTVFALLASALALVGFGQRAAGPAGSKTPVLELRSDGS